MGEVAFDPDSWTAGGKAMDDGADALYAGCHSVTIAELIQATSGSPVDEAAASGDASVHKPWYVLVSNAMEAMAADASRMDATGKNYRDMEARGTKAAKRFWKG